jgi:hypothetical protein
MGTSLNAMLLLRLIRLNLLRPSKNKSLLSSLIKEGHLDALVIDELELSTSFEETNDLLVFVAFTSHASAGPLGINVEGSIIVDSVAGPVGVAAYKMYLVGEEDLTYVFFLVGRVLNEEGEAEERVVSRGLRRDVIVLVSGEAQLEGKHQEECDAQDFHRLFEYYTT